MHLHNKHMDLVDAVNNAPDERLRREADVKLGGWLEGLADCGRNRGMMLIDADNEQFSRGFNVPMCGGVFLHPMKEA